MGMSAAIKAAIGDYTCRGDAPAALTAPVKLSLHTGDPGTTGANEATGGTYARQTAGYAASSSAVNALGGSVSFTGLASGTYTHLGRWDSAGTPTFIQGIALTVPQAVPAGGTLTITAASITTSG